MRPRYDITVTITDDGLWMAYRHATTPSDVTRPLLTSSGTTLRDALDELAIELERERQNTTAPPTDVRGAVHQGVPSTENPEGWDHPLP